MAFDAAEAKHIHTRPSVLAHTVGARKHLLNRVLRRQLRDRGVPTPGRLREAPFTRSTVAAFGLSTAKPPQAKKGLQLLSRLGEHD